MPSRAGGHLPGLTRASRVTDCTHAHRTTDDHDRSLELRDAIDRTGYYPDVVVDGVAAAVAGEQVVSFFVHHEPTFDRDEVRRHLSVVVLTPSRLILAHTDEHAGDDLLPEPYTSTSTEAIRLQLGDLGRGDPDGRQPDHGADRAGRGRDDHRLGRRSAASTSSRPAATTRSARPTTATPACWPPTTSRCASPRRPTAPTPSRGCCPSPSRSPRGPTRG